MLLDKTEFDQADLEVRIFEDDVDLMLLMLQEPLSVQHSRSQQEAQQSQQNVYCVHQVQPTT